MSTDIDVRDVQRVLVEVLDERMPLAAVRQEASSPSGYDRDLWRELATEFGICEMHLPAGPDGPVDAAMVWGVAEILGARLAAVPYAATVVLGSLPLARADRTAAGDDLLGRLLAGETSATFAWPTCAWRLEVGRLHGQSDLVLHGADSEWILMIDRSRLLGVHREAGVVRRRLDSIDMTRPVAELRFTGAEVVELGEIAPGAAGRHRLDLMTYLAHESAGGTRRVKDMAVDYVKVRQQFGRPIGSFQAIKHLSADLAIDTVAAAAVARRAASEFDDASYPEAAAQAYLYASAAFVRSARASLHAHGGVGFTWEFDSHLFYRRAYAAALVLGRPSDLRSELGRSLLGSVAAG